MSQDAIRVMRQGRVQWIAINRPNVANAIDDDVVEGFVDALRLATDDHSIGAVVLSGAGARVFSAGVDLKNPNALSADDLGEVRRLRVTRSLDAIVGFEKPLVAAVNGVASGAGAMLALLADLSVAAPLADLVFPEIDVGMPSFLALEIVSRLAGEQIALDLILTGRRITAEEAVRRGLYGAVVEAEGLQAHAQALAERLAAKSAISYTLNKRWVNEQRRAVLQRAADEARRVRPLLLAGAAGGPA